MNEFCIIGRLTDDPELKMLENNDKVVNVTVAVDRDYKDKNGKKKTDFLKFALWNKKAENLCKLSKKGSLVQIKGYIVTKKEKVGDKVIEKPWPVVTQYTHIQNKKDLNKSVESSKETEGTEV